MAANLLQRAYAFFDPHIAVNDQGYLVNAEGFFDSGTESRDYINPDELSDTRRQMYYNSEFAGFDPLEGFMLDPDLDENGSIEHLVQTVSDAAAQQQQAAQSSADRAMEFSASEAEKARAFNADQAELNRQFQLDQTQKAMDYQTMMSNTAYQRAMADLQAAGINPKLVAQLGGASTPSGIAASGSAASSQYVPGGSVANMAAADVSAISQVLSTYITGADAMDRKQLDFVQGVLSALVKIAISFL